jgi:hypothetical protein
MSGKVYVCADEEPRIEKGIDVSVRESGGVG